jgi:hypothetical protein
MGVDKVLYEDLVEIIGGPGSPQEKALLVIEAGWRAPIPTAEEAMRITREHEEQRKAAKKIKDKGSIF